MVKLRTQAINKLSLFMLTVAAQLILKCLYYMLDSVVFNSNNLMDC